MDQLPSEFKAILNFLRDFSSSSCIEGVVSEKRVEIFKGEVVTKALLSNDYKEKFPKIPIVDKREAHEVLQSLLEAGAFVPVTQSRGRYYQPTMARKWYDEHTYAWIFEGSQLFNIIYVLLAVAAVVCIFMYPLWPSPLKSIAWYVIMALASFVAFILVLSVIRLVVFIITYFSLRPGIWLFPNLYADVGFIESFIPVYSWNN